MSGLRFCGNSAARRIARRATLYGFDPNPALARVTIVTRDVNWLNSRI